MSVSWYRRQANDVPKQSTQFRRDPFLPRRRFARVSCFEVWGSPSAPAARPTAFVTDVTIYKEAVLLVEWLHAAPGFIKFRMIVCPAGRKRVTSSDLLISSSASVRYLTSASAHRSFFFFTEKELSACVQKNACKRLDDSLRNSVEIISSGNSHFHIYLVYMAVTRQSSVTYVSPPQQSG
jgi:hypothetical protein